MPRYIGIDFSGNQAQWQPNRVDGNVWIATLEADRDVVKLLDLHRVQDLPGDERPFQRLVALLRNENLAAAAIDAPFSIPWWLFGEQFADHEALLTAIDALPLHGVQDFPNGHALVACVRENIQFEFSKPLRVTEHYWTGRRVNVRSTVWQGPRPGAPFASACIKLLARAQRPIWPWDDAQDGTAMVMEAFPAAQLRHWELPCAGYNGPLGQERPSSGHSRSLDHNVGTERFQLRRLPPQLAAASSASSNSQVAVDNRPRVDGKQSASSP